MGVLKDFECPSCGDITELIVSPDEKVNCIECGTELVRSWRTPLNHLTTIVPSRPGSKKHCLLYTSDAADE